MDKSEKEILNKLRRQADQFEMPVEAFVWDAIQKEVAPQKKKRRFGFWWIGGAAILAASIFFILGYALKKQTSKNKLTTAKERLIITPALNHKLLGSVAKVVQYPAQRFNSLQNTEMQSLIEAEELQNDNSLRSIAQRTNSFKRSTLTPSITISNVNNAITEKNQDEELTFNNAEDKLVVIKNGLDAARVLEVEVKTKNDRDTLSLITSTIDNVPTETDSISDEEVSAVLEAIADTIPQKKNTRSFTLLLHGGVGESFRSLKSSTHHDLITHKNEHETFGECFEIGLDAQFKLGNRFIGRTGLGYKFYSDKYDFQHDLIKHTTRNDYQYLQVPLIVGFNLLPRPKSNLYLLGGVRANLLSSAQSSWVDVDALAPVAYSNASTNTPFRSVTAAVNLGLDYNFSFTDKFSIHFIPSVDAFLNSVYKRQTDLNQRPYSVNIDLGISYNF
jgi:hypothetical protein